MPYQALLDQAETAPSLDYSRSIKIVPVTGATPTQTAILAEVSDRTLDIYTEAALAESIGMGKREVTRSCAQMRKDGTLTGGRGSNPLRPAGVVKRHARISRAWLDDPQLTRPILMLLIWLLFHADKTGYCYPTLDGLIKQIGKKRSWIMDGLAQLKSLGYLDHYYLPTVGSSCFRLNLAYQASPNVRDSGLECAGFRTGYKVKKQKEHSLSEKLLPDGKQVQTLQILWLWFWTQLLELGMPKKSEWIIHNRVFPHLHRLGKVEEAISICSQEAPKAKKNAGGFFYKILLGVAGLDGGQREKQGAELRQRRQEKAKKRHLSVRLAGRDDREIVRLETRIKVRADEIEQWKKAPYELIWSELVNWVDENLSIPENQKMPLVAFARQGEPMNLEGQNNEDARDRIRNEVERINRLVNEK